MNKYFNFNLYHSLFYLLYSNELNAKLPKKSVGKTNISIILPKISSTIIVYIRLI